MSKQKQDEHVRDLACKLVDNKEGFIAIINDSDAMKICVYLTHKNGLVSIANDSKHCSIITEQYEMCEVNNRRTIKVERITDETFGQCGDKDCNMQPIHSALIEKISEELCTSHQKYMLSWCS